MSDNAFIRKPFDLPTYLARVHSRCFICALRDGAPGYEHEMLIDELEHGVLEGLALVISPIIFGTGRIP